MKSIFTPLFVIALFLIVSVNMSFSQTGLEAGDTIYVEGPVDSVQTCSNNTLLIFNRRVNYYNWRIKEMAFKQYNDTSLYIANLPEGDTFVKNDSTDESFKIQNFHIGSITNFDTVACKPWIELYTYDASNDSVFWRVMSGDGIIADTKNSITVLKNMSVGINKVFWTIKNDFCKDSAIVKINYKHAEAGENYSVCDDFTTLAGNPPPSNITGYWENVDGYGLIHSPEKYNTYVKNLRIGSNTFRWNIDYDECIAQDSVIVVNQKVVASLGDDRMICEKAPVISAGSLDKNAQGYWRIESGAGNFDEPASPATQVRGLASGINVISWTITRDYCMDSDKITLINNAFEVDAGDDQEVCGEEANLSAEKAKSGYGYWKVESDNKSQIANKESHKTKVSGLEVGANTFTWTVEANGCTASDKVIVRNNKYIPEAGENQSVCRDEVSLSALAPPIAYNYPHTYGKWTIASGGGSFEYINNTNTSHYVDPAHQPVALVKSLARGINVFRWEFINKGCNFYDEVFITNNTINSTAGEDFWICESNETNLKAIAPPSTAKGEWSLKSSAGFPVIESNSAYNTKVSDLAFGFNTFVWYVKDINGCSRQTEVTVDNRNIPIKAGYDQVLAKVNSTTLDAENDFGNGIWSVVKGACQFVCSTNPQTDAIGFKEGYNTLRWTINNKGCIRYDDVDILYVGPDNIYAGENQTLCADSTVMTAYLPPSENGTWWILEGGAYIEELHSPGSRIFNLKHGLNRFMWMVSCGGQYCKDTVDIYNFKGIPGFDVKDNQFIPEIEKLEISNIKPDNQELYVWQFGDDSKNKLIWHQGNFVENFVFDNDTFYIDIETGKYVDVSLKIVSAEGCTNTYTKSVYIAEKPNGIQFNESESDIKIYPNPAKTVINVSAPQGLNADFPIEIYTVEGKKVYTTVIKPENKYNISINVAILPKGYYFISFVHQTTKIIKPFIRY